MSEFKLMITNDNDSGRFFLLNLDDDEKNLLSVEWMVLCIFSQGRDTVEGPIMWSWILPIFKFQYFKYLAMENVSKISTGLHLAVPQ